MCYSGTHAHTRAPCAHTFVLLDGFLVTSARSWWQVPSADPRLLQTQPLVLPPGSPRALQARPEGGGMEHREVVTSTWLDSQDSPASPPGRHLLDSLQPAEASPPDTAASAGELLGVRSKNRCSPPPPPHRFTRGGSSGLPGLLHPLSSLLAPRPSTGYPVRRHSPHCPIG